MELYGGICSGIYLNVLESGRISRIEYFSFLSDQLKRSCNNTTRKTGESAKTNSDVFENKSFGTAIF